MGCAVDLASRFPVSRIWPGIWAYNQNHPVAARAMAKLDDAPQKFRSTQRRQPGILMTVHPVLPGNLKPHNSSFLDPDRVDNLLEAHI